MRKPRIHYPGALYNVVTRGNGGKDIFCDEMDYLRFLDELGQLRASGLEFLGYCLMPNHLHLVVRVAEITLSVLMQRLLSSYAQYFNIRRGTFGNVFQSRFKERLIETEEYLRNAVAYAHFNPVEARLVASPAQWRWSGHNGMVMGNDRLLDAAAVMARLGGPLAYEELLQRQALRVKIASRGRSPAACQDLALIGIDCAQQFLVSEAELRSRQRAQPIVRARRLFVRRALDCGFARTLIAEYLDCSNPAISKMLAARQVNS